MYRFHIEYVPTQVVGEYVRHLLRTTDGRPVAGLMYRSVKNPNSKNVVYFVGPEGCIDDADADPDRIQLRLLRDETTRRVLNGPNLHVP